MAALVERQKEIDVSAVNDEGITALIAAASEVTNPNPKPDPNPRLHRKLDPDPDPYLYFDPASHPTCVHTT